MANPAAEKFKALALKFGDKVAVALASVLLLVFVVLGFSKETIDTTPGEITDLSTSARNNLSRPQPEEVIVGKLESDGMVPQGFIEKVNALTSAKVDTSRIELVRPFVRTEPGAGLIRGEVKEFLPAPYDLYATAGRGGVALFVLDESGNPVPDEPKTGPGQVAGSGGRGGSMMGSSSYGGTGGTPKKSDIEEQERRRREELAKQKTNRGIRGATAAPKEEPEEEAVALGPNVEYKKETEGLRWVSVIGLLDHKKLRDQYAKALKVEFTQAHPDYLRLELERQVYDPVSSAWGQWTAVDDAANDQILDRVAYTESEKEELTLAEARLEPLVDFLPYLASGYWAGAHHGQVIDPAKLESAKPAAGAASSGGAMMGGPAGMGGGMSGMSGMSGMGEGMSEGDYGMSGSAGGGRGAAMMGGGSSFADEGMMGGGAMMGGSPAGAQVEHTSDAETIMVRALDLTVSADVIYRYRARIVVANPNLNREDVAPGVDNTSEEFLGPWSEPTVAVSVPPDVAPYAWRPARDASGQVDFDVIAWNPDTGATVHRRFSAAPGEFVGQQSSALVPVEGEEKPKPQAVDFTSRQLLVDAMGGQQPVQRLGMVGAPLDVPAVATLLRPDGTVTIRNQANDQLDEQLAFMRESYRLSIAEDPNKKTRGSMAGMYGGGMSGMYGMSGGGMEGMDGGSGYGPGGN